MEDLTPLQSSNINHAVKKMYQSERIVNYDLDFSKWKIKHLYGTTLWVKLLDEPDADTVMRGLIAVPVAQAKAPYRLGKVIMCGPDTKHAVEGEIVRFPQGQGQPYEKIVDGYKTWLLREESVIAVVEFEGTQQELDVHLTNDLHAQL